ncbi:MAG: hypothetical protein QOI25_2520, partial [Mycobacterium sp.]|nr:hypothetical protein [Mycobacterium sp.]
TTSKPITCTRHGWRSCVRSPRTGCFNGEDSYVRADGFAGIADRKLSPDDVVLYKPAGAAHRPIALSAGQYAGQPRNRLNVAVLVGPSIGLQQIAEPYLRRRCVRMIP